LSAEVRMKARHPANSCLVQAPAGSGKTELLTQRILALLTIVDEPEEILALTFTRKAAAEMRTRVMEALCSPRPDDRSDQAESHRIETWNLARKAMQRSGERGWRLTDHPARLRIMTLDSLSYSLARQLPLLSGLGEMPTPSEHTDALYREVAESALNQAMRDYSDVAEDVLLHQDHNAVAVIRLLSSMLEKREQWLQEIAMYARDMDALRRLLEANLKAIMMHKLIRCNALTPPWLKAQLPALMRFAGRNREDEALARISSWPDASLDMLSQWRLVADFLLTGSDPLFRKSGGVNVRLGFPASKDCTEQKEEIKQCLDMLADLPALADSLHELRTLPASAVMDERQWQVLKSLFILLILANSHLQRLFGRQSEADFSEIALRAMNALGANDAAPGDLLMKLDYSIRHILVDEFQDTSLLHMRMLQCLTAGWQEGDGRHRSLFMVGDPMQSIYRFRKAEIGLFLSAARNEAGLPIVESLQLDRNFRSSPAIVAWVNRAFRFIFPASQDVLSGAVTYTPAIAALSHAGAVNLHLQSGRDAEQEAEAVIQLVRKELAIAACNGEKQSIGILVRSRKHLHVIMPALRAANISFRAIKILPLDKQPEVRLLRALLRALLHPVDRESWAAILRAQCCGLTSHDMYALMAGDNRPLWQIMGDDEAIERMSPDAQMRVVFVRNALAPCMSISGAVSVRDLLEMAWLRLSMPRMIDTTASLNVDSALALITSLEEGGRINFPLLDERLQKLYAAPDASEAAQVELLTMHGAKGLQWDVVILPGLGYGGRQSDSPLLAFSDVPVAGGTRLLISPKPATRKDDPLYSFIRSIEKSKDNNELQRLLYVACTRCKTTLHMLGHLSGKREEATKGSLLHLLLAGGDDCFGAQLFPINPAEQHINPARKPLQRISCLPELPPEGRENLGEQETEYVWAGAEAAPVGNAVHAALQHVAEIGIENWSEEDTVEERSRISRMLMADGLSAEMLEAASTRCSDGLQRVLNSERGRWLLSAGHSDAHSEWALSLRQAGQVSHHIIDRSFVDDRGVRWIVDYKTGSHLGGDIEAFLDREQERHADQLRRYAEVVRQMEDRPVRLGLYFPMLDAWRELPP